MNAILHDYYFIAITERMNESIVVLMMLLHLTIADVLYLCAKTTGGYNDGTYNNRCTLVQPNVVSPNMTQYFACKSWQNVIQFCMMPQTNHWI
jgi:hypothetical protein